jgi:hypothetical protein
MPAGWSANNATIRTDRGTSASGDPNRSPPHVERVSGRRRLLRFLRRVELCLELFDMLLVEICPHFTERAPRLAEVHRTLVELDADETHGRILAPTCPQAYSITVRTVANALAGTSVVAS